MKHARSEYYYCGREDGQACSRAFRSQCCVTRYRKSLAGVAQCAYRFGPRGSPARAHAEVSAGMGFRLFA